MRDIILNILASIVASTTVSATLIWLAKTWISERLKNSIQHEYDQKIETYKAELKAEHDIKIEQLRTDLRIITSEHEIRFTKLHEKVFDTIADVYARLLDVYDCLFQCVKVARPFEGVIRDVKRRTIQEYPTNEDITNLKKALKTFQDYFRPKRIYLSRHSANNIEEFIDKVENISSQVLISLSQAKMSESLSSLMEAFEDTTSEAKSLLGLLEDEFRVLLGSESKEKIN